MSKCFHCNCKISQLDILTNTCRCNHNFCSKHRVNHDCQFDYKQHYRENNTLVKIKNERVHKI